MTEKCFEVKWNGKKYLLIGDKKNGGAIATRRQFRGGFISAAHLFADGVIKVHGRIVGSRDDIKTLKRIAAPPPFRNALDHLFHEIDRMCSL